MKYEYILYERDVSFDYGDFPGANCSGTEKNGFSIDIDIDDHVDMDSLEGFGDFQNLEKDITTKQGLIDFINENEEYIEEINPRCQFTNKELFEELVEILEK